MVMLLDIMLYKFNIGIDISVTDVTAVWWMRNNCM